MEGTEYNDRHMEMKFVIDKITNDEAYPNLANGNAVPLSDEWQQFSTVTPYSEPVMLFKYLSECNVPYSFVDYDCEGAFYPIALSYFDFSIDWFELMSATLISKLKDGVITVLFYYSEGDNPHDIDAHLSKQCNEHDIPRAQVKFISANSVANDIDYFYHIVDDELLFQYRNKKHPPGFYHEETRQKKFTALVRMHKFWRANTMASLWRGGFDADGYFAYGDEVTAGEVETDNPIEVDNYVGLRKLTDIFLSCVPFSADSMTSIEHNDHVLQVRKHYEDAYVNIVLESHMDVDQSNGVFLTEKTFKPIKNSQLFIIFGAVGSIQHLRDIGYKTFDTVINHKYDKIQNTTKRWKSAMDTTTALLSHSNNDIKQMYIACKDDIIHNQSLFHESKKNRLTKLIKDIHND